MHTPDRCGCGLGATSISGSDVGSRPLPVTIRDDLADVAPYSTPRPPARYLLNTNESPYPPPKAVVEAVQDAIGEMTLNRYPDHSASGLYEAIARHAGLPSEGIWVANGSNEIFLHLFLAFR